MVRPAPDRHSCGQAQPDHRPRNFVSLTYLNGCKAKQRSIEGVWVNDEVTITNSVTQLCLPAGDAKQPYEVNQDFGGKGDLCA
jgi:hypothetical protein